MTEYSNHQDELKNQQRVYVISNKKILTGRMKEYGSEYIEYSRMMNPE